MKKVIIVILIVMAWYGIGLWGSHIHHDNKYQYVCVDGDVEGWGLPENECAERVVPKSMWNNSHGDTTYALTTAIAGPSRLIASLIR